ncbi:hypothetical protein [Phaeobacter sp. B1627]|uniref:hypothetical protein n=1 Tax=Phaeobacter sp. B1627 TaxID=2583809 RepID=UPI00111AA32D|nr:hypothetical protein [Phaeobacter sp. B1627]TNJ43989.1 hypothetical protein FGE21_08455 [Phaeobacter sp. B1627]
MRVGTGRHVVQEEQARLAAKGNDDLSHSMPTLLSVMTPQLDVINDRIAAIDVEITVLAKADPEMQWLMDNNLS